MNKEKQSDCEIREHELLVIIEGDSNRIINLESQNKILMEMIERMDRVINKDFSNGNMYEVQLLKKALEQVRRIYES